MLPLCFGYSIHCQSAWVPCKDRYRESNQCMAAGRKHGLTAVRCWYAAVYGRAESKPRLCIICHLHPDNEKRESYMEKSPLGARRETEPNLYILRKCKKQEAANVAIVLEHMIILIQWNTDHCLQTGKKAGTAPRMKSAVCLPPCAAMLIPVLPVEGGVGAERRSLDRGIFCRHDHGK